MHWDGIDQTIVELDGITSILRYRITPTAGGDAPFVAAL